eukprot:scaffold24376_cov78-Phaeocystis_antarctica.AAC.2
MGRTAITSAGSRHRPRSSAASATRWRAYAPTRHLECGWGQRATCHGASMRARQWRGARVRWPSCTRRPRHSCAIWSASCVHTLVETQVPWRIRQSRGRMHCARRRAVVRGLSTAREAGGAHQSQVSVAQELAKSSPSFLHPDRRFARRPASTNIAGRKRSGGLGGQRGPAALTRLAPCAWQRLRAPPKHARHASAHGLCRLEILQPPQPEALIAHVSMWRRGHRAHIDGAIDQMPPPFYVQSTKLQLERAQLDVRVICAHDTHTRR